MARLGCPIEGCYTLWATDGGHRRKHLETPHVKCRCGWVGISLNVHIAQRRRRGFPLDGCGYSDQMAPAADA